MADGLTGRDSDLAPSRLDEASRLATGAARSLDHRMVVVSAAG